MIMCLDCGNEFKDIKKHAKSEIKKINGNRVDLIRKYVDAEWKDEYHMTDKQIAIYHHLDHRVTLLIRSMSLNYKMF